MCLCMWSCMFAAVGLLNFFPGRSIKTHQKKSLPAKPVAHTHIHTDIYNPRAHQSLFMAYYHLTFVSFLPHTALKDVSMQTACLQAHTSFSLKLNMKLRHLDVKWKQLLNVPSVQQFKWLQGLYYMSFRTKQDIGIEVSAAIDHLAECVNEQRQHKDTLEIWQKAPLSPSAQNNTLNDVTC